MLAYYGTALSDHITKKPSGGIVCTDVPIARTGTQEYLAGELGLGGDPERVILVTRAPEEVFAPEAMASFEGVCVCDDHPPESVTAVNFSQYSKGHAQNVRREGEYLVADLHIEDAVLADQVLHRAKREVSCGYTTTYVPDGGGYRQTNIRGNHVAVVLRGRAGSEVSIKDAAQGAGKGRKTMSKFTEAILQAFGMAAREADGPEELPALVSTAASVLDAAPDEGKPAAPPAKEEGTSEPPPGKADPAANAPEQGPTPTDDLGMKLDKVLELLSALQHSGREEPPAKDEKALDSLIEQLSGGAADSLPPAAELLKRMRPAVAGIQDTAARARVVDALVSAVGGPGLMGQVAQAAADNARKAADAARASTFEERCRESEAAYAARNPHKRQEQEG